MILGLTKADAGTATIGGRTYHELRAPLREIGAVINPGAVNPSRTAAEHLRWLAISNGIARQRVEITLGLVGLDTVAGRKVGSFSLGMRQRLGIAAALIGDPPVLLLDEPINGLDPEGIRWIRTFMQELANEGRTIFVSSHLMSEMALTADHLVVIGLGKILADEPMADFIAKNSVSYVRVRSPRMTDLAPKLAMRGWKVEQQPDASAHVFDAQPSEIGDVAGAEGLWIHELTLVQSSLEEAFMRLTAGSVEYQAGRADAQRGLENSEAAGWGTQPAAQNAQAKEHVR
jgi:ABC-2 type transport system ATP-binding protein